MVAFQTENRKISDSEFIAIFEQYNFNIRTHMMNNLYKNWDSNDESGKLAIFIGIFEQYVSQLEDFVMLLWSLIKKRNRPSKSLYYYYATLNVKETISGEYSTENLIKKLSTPIDNSGYCDLLGLNLSRINLEPKGDELKNFIDHIILDLKNRSINVPFAKANNSIKHGFRIRLIEINNKKYLRFLMKTESIDDGRANVEVADLPFDKETVDTFFKESQTSCKYFQGLFLLISLSFS